MPDVFGGARMPPTSVPQIPTGQPAPSSPVQTTAPEGSPASPAGDVESLEKELREAGMMFGQSDWSTKNARERLRSLRQNFTKQGSELADYKKKWGEIEPLAEQLKDDRFRSAIGQAAQTYFDSESNPGSFTPAQPLSVLSNFDPINRRLDQVETQLTVQRIDSELESLVSRGFPMNEEMRDVIQNQMLTNRWGTAEQNYMALFGPQLVEIRAQEATRAAMEAVKQNNGSYTQGAPRSAPVSTAPDLASMSPAERSEYTRRRVEEILSKK